MTISEKAAYIKGLMDGLSLDDSKPETKILKQMADVIEELATANSSLIEENIKLKDYIEEIDSDLGDLEEYVYGSGNDGDDDGFCEYGYDEDDDNDGDDDDGDDEDND